MASSFRLDVVAAVQGGLADFTRLTNSAKAWVKMQLGLSGGGGDQDENGLLNMQVQQGSLLAFKTHTLMHISPFEGLWGSKKARLTIAAHTDKHRHVVVLFLHFLNQCSSILNWLIGGGRMKFFGGGSSSSSARNEKKQQMSLQHRTHLSLSENLNGMDDEKMKRGGRRIGMHIREVFIHAFIQVVPTRRRR